MNVPLECIKKNRKQSIDHFEDNKNRYPLPLAAEAVTHDSMRPSRSTYQTKSLEKPIGLRSKNMVHNTGGTALHSLVKSEIADKRKDSCSPMPPNHHVKFDVAPYSNPDPALPKSSSTWNRWITIRCIGSSLGLRTWLFNFVKEAPTVPFLGDWQNKPCHHNLIGSPVGKKLPKRSNNVRLGGG